MGGRLTGFPRIKNIPARESGSALCRTAACGGSAFYALGERGRKQVNIPWRGSAAFMCGGFGKKDLTGQKGEVDVGLCDGGWDCGRGVDWRCLVWRGSARRTHHVKLTVNVDEFRLGNRIIISFGQNARDRFLSVEFRKIFPEVVKAFYALLGKAVVDNL